MTFPLLYSTSCCSLGLLLLLNLTYVTMLCRLVCDILLIFVLQRQSTVTLMPPNSDQISPFIGYLVSAFMLKLIAFAHMLYVQCGVDIFFIDWERPRGRITASNDAQQQGKEAPVSIWRTYFVANEWNEIQSCRKINNIFQIFAVILFLDVIGFGGWATQEPDSSLNPGSDVYVSPYNPIFRFATSSLVYLVIGTYTRHIYMLFLCSVPIFFSL